MRAFAPRLKTHDSGRLGKAHEIVGPLVFLVGRSQLLHRRLLHGRWGYDGDLIWMNLQLLTESDGMRWWMRAWSTRGRYWI